jgi:hypothetical protein
VTPRGADTSPTCAGRNLICQVAEWATLRAGGDELVKLRRQPGEARGVKLSTSFLKHSDDQTVLGLAAVLKAIARRDQSVESYRDWGLVAGPKMFGRDSMAWVVARYLAEGAWGIPPHIIPHGILHADSGTISQALSLHGPNISVSGGPNACSEAFLIAASLFAENNLPGLWLVLSAFEAEKVPEDAACAGMQCDAVALALKAVPSLTPSSSALRINLGPDVPAGLTDFTLPGFSAVVQKEGTGRWRLPDVGWIELQRL